MTIRALTLLALAFLAWPARAAEPAHDRFAFLRHVRVGPGQGYIEEDAIVLATFAENKTDLQVYSLKGTGRFTGPWIVGGNRVYLSGSQGLLALDLADGEVWLVAEGVANPILLGGRLYFPAPDGRYKALDPRAATISDVPCPVPQSGRGRPVLSPDGTRFAWTMREHATSLPIPYRAYVTDVATGASVHIGDKFNWELLATGLEACPRVGWLDNTHLLMVRTEIPAKNIHVGSMTMEGLTDYLVLIDLSTGKASDIAPLQAGYADFIHVPGVGLVMVTDTGVGGSASYRIALQEKKLIDAPIPLGPAKAKRINGAFAENVFSVEQLTVGDTVLAERANVYLAPDVSRLVYTVHPPRGGASRLFYLGPDKQAVQVATLEGVAGGRWLTAEDLKPAAVAGPAEPQLPAGVSRLVLKPWSGPRVPEQARPDARLDVSTALTLAASTDRLKYALHEPVTLTLTLTNTSQRDLPVTGLKLTRGSVMLRLKGPRTDRSSPDYDPEPAKVTLKPGEAISERFTFEPARPGNYAITKIEYGGFPWDTFKGDYVRAADVPFTVVSGKDDGVLLAAKITRVADKLRADKEVPRSISDYHHALDALVSVGTGVTPPLLEAIGKEKDDKVRHWLMRACVKLEDPAVIGPAAQWLTSDAAIERIYAIHAMQGLARSDQTEAAHRTAALDVLASALSNRDAGTRQHAAALLARVRDAHTDEICTAALDNQDPAVRDIAARYLAAAEDKTLAEWLSSAAEAPSKPHYLGARAIVPQLESLSHTSKGKLPDLDFAAFSADHAARSQFATVLRGWLEWARENPTISEQFFESGRRTWPGGRR